MKLICLTLLSLQALIVRSQNVEYKGCFVDSNDRDLAPYINNVGSRNNVNSCINTCKSFGYRYAGLQATHWCLCGNSFGKHGQVNNGQCNSNCPGNSRQKCGAGWRNSVWSTGLTVEGAISSYKGCFVDSADRDLAPYIHNVGASNTATKCINTCRSLGYRYAGVQATHWCLCGNSFGKHGRVSDSQCSSNCPGNSAQKCGAGWRNSVFATGIKTTINDVSHLGCFKDTGDNRDLGYLKNVGSSNSVTSCVALCKNMGYRYSGVQATTWCLCGNRYGVHGRVGNQECSHNCPGDATQKCGAGWRNSIWTTGLEAAPATVPKTYLGCYIDSADRDLPYLKNVGASNSASSCVVHCRNMGYRYAGVQATTWCLCGNTYGKHGAVSIGQCSSTCPGNRAEKCGAGWRNSLYDTKLTVDSGSKAYKGCFIDSGDRDLAPYINRVGNHNTVDGCVRTCKAHGYRYAGLQATHWCLCGNSFGKHGQVSNGQCSSTCPGNGGQKCGAGWRNSVWSTGLSVPSPGKAYLGCYIDSSDRDLAPYIHNVGNRNTASSCVNTCKALGYRYAGVQATHWCLCGNSFGKHGQVSNAQCSSSCPGNANEKCGAGWRNSVWRT